MRVVSRPSVAFAYNTHMDAFPSGLDLFVAVHRDDVATCQNSGRLPRRLLGGLDYIGVRESAAGLSTSGREGQ